MNAGRMLVVSGPSGSGKSTICKRLLQDPRVLFSVSATTRKPRPGEVDGRDYYFLSVEDFRRKIAEGAFLEHAEVFGNLYGTLRGPLLGNLYGTLRGPLLDAKARGQIYLLEIDVQGANQLRALGEEGLYIFIAPPDFEELKRRLAGRGTESPEVLQRRLHKAEDEMRERHRYDHIVINDDLDRAVAEVRQLVGLDTASTEVR